MKKLIAALALLLAGCSAPVPKHAAAKPPPLPPGAPGATAMAAKTGSARTKSLKAASFTAATAKVADPCAVRAVRGPGSILLEWPCLTNANFRIETSLNLLEWKIVGTSINSAPEYPLTNSVLIVIESDPHYAYRFYRVVPIAETGDRL